MIRIIIEIDNDQQISINQCKIADVLKKTDPTETRNEEIKAIKKKPITKKKRECPKCGEEFTPTGNRQKYCSEKCGMKPKVYKKKKPIEPIERTLEEIEERKKETYKL